MKPVPESVMFTVLSKPGRASVVPAGLTLLRSGLGSSTSMVKTGPSTRTLSGPTRSRMPPVEAPVGTAVFSRVPSGVTS